MSFVRIDTRDEVALLTIDRPKANAFSPELVSELSAAFVEVETARATAASAASAVADKRAEAATRARESAADRERLSAAGREEAEWRKRRENAEERLAQGAEVGGRASNVNGRITLDAAHIGGGIETVSGDVEIGANSRVEGGLLVDKPHGFSWGKSKNPRVVIGPHAVVDGTLEFRRDVDLYVSDTAKVGTITGATANKFSGDHP